ncbi:MAG: formimidoylglutamase [Vicingaceae bacterium]
MEINLLEKVDLQKLVSKRDGETKLGEKVLCGGEYLLDNLSDCPAQFVVFGIPEDAGPRANLGKAGANSAWNAFLPKFVNVQHNQFLEGESILLVGAFDFTQLEGYGSSNLSKLRSLVAKIDDVISEFVEQVARAEKIPIAIGGGHNNAYGMLKGTSNALGKAINCINLDPHADYRELEGRHSGNGFSYAKKNGFLADYFVSCLHESYNSQQLLDKMNADGVNYNFWDAVLRDEITFDDAIMEGFNAVKASTFGVELDCDSIQDFPSSAQSPNGISTDQARKFILQVASYKNAAYLHLPEAAPDLVIDSRDQVGKLLAYLVSDFVKVAKKNHE